MATYQGGVEGGAVHAEARVRILIGGRVGGRVDTVEAGDAGDSSDSGGGQTAVGALKCRQPLVLARAHGLPGDRVGHERAPGVAARRRGPVAGHAAAYAGHAR